METERRTGRLVGALILAQMVGSYVVNFVLLAPLSSAPGGLLVNAAKDPLRVGVWALAGLVAGALSLAIGITAWPVLRRHSARLALWIVALGAVSLALLVVEHAGLLAVLSLSEAYSSAPAPPAGLYEAVALLARSLRNWMHYSGLVVAGSMYLVFFATLYRDRLVPRPLSGFGVLAVLLQIASVSLPFLGREVSFPLLMPVGLSHLALSAWLLWRGFNDTPAGGA